MNSRGKLIPYVGPWKKGEKCMVWLAKSPRSPKRSTLPGLLNFFYGLPNNSKIASFPCLIVFVEWKSYWTENMEYAYFIRPLSTCNRQKRSHKSLKSEYETAMTNSSTFCVFTWLKWVLIAMKSNEEIVWKWWVVVKRKQLVKLLVFILRILF